MYTIQNQNLVNKKEEQIDKKKTTHLLFLCSDRDFFLCSMRAPLTKENKMLAMNTIEKLSLLVLVINAAHSFHYNSVVVVLK